MDSGGSGWAGTPHSEHRDLLVLHQDPATMPRISILVGKRKCHTAASLSCVKLLPSLGQGCRE